jgi:hypothetical protein
MKKCNKCLIEKPLSDFGKNKSKKDGVQTYCAPCRSEYHKQLWRNNQGGIKERHSRYSKAYKSKVRDFVTRYKKLCKCVDCGNSDYRVLHFDHLNNKLFNIADAVSRGYSIAKIKKEIRKCEIRCANCHIIKSWYT